MMFTRLARQLGRDVGARLFHHDHQQHIVSNLVPIVIESTPKGERAWDIFSRLLRERIVYVNGPIHQNSADVIVAQLLFLESEDPDKPISMYIHSPGGVVSAGMAIYDTMQYISCPVHTMAVGHAASMASLLLAAGEKHHRSALPNTRVMIHQPSGGAQGQASDIAIQANEILTLRNQLNKLYASHTGQDIAEIQSKMERDTFMSAEEAKAFGLIDEVLVHRKTPEATQE